MPHVMGTRNERLLLDRPNIVVEGSVEYQSIELIGGRQKKFTLSALADGLLLLYAEHKTAVTDSGFFDAVIKLLPKPFDRIALMQALIGNGGDIRAEFQRSLA